MMEFRKNKREQYMFRLIPISLQRAIYAFAEDEIL